jgi:Tfp pilus assembly protein PilO
VIGRIWLVAGAALVLLVIVWFFALWLPASRELDDANDELDAAEATIQELEQERERLRVATEDAPVIQTQLRTLEAAIPGRPDLADFMLSLSEAEVASGLEIVSVTTGEPREESPGLTTIPVDLELNGGYFQLLDFINRVTQAQRLYVIDALDIESLAEEASTTPPDLAVTLVGRVFTTVPADDVTVPEEVVLPGGTGP